MVKRFAVAAAVLAALGAPALGQGRPDARAMTCGEVQAMIGARGAVVMTTGRHTYERFVTHAGYCMHLELPVPVNVTTRDTDRCTVYRCQTVADEGGVWQN